MNKLHGLFNLIKKPFNWFRKIKLRNKIIVIVVIGFFGFLGYRNIMASSSEPQFITQAVERGNVSQIVSETGNINGAGRVDVYSSSTGIVEEFYIQDGDVVQLNQNLFKVTSTATEEEKAAAYAAYKSAASSLKTAEQSKQSLDAAMWTAQKAKLDTQETERIKNEDANKNDNYTDLEQRSIDAASVQAEKNFTAAEQKYIEADVAISAAKAQVNSAWLAYQATQTKIVKAPTAGTIANLAYLVGDNVVAPTATIKLPVLAITNPNGYSVKLALNEVDIPKVKIGQSAEITLDAFYGKKFSGEVVQVDSLGTNTAGVITYNVIVRITNPEDSIRQEMTANVDIKVDSAQNVLTVPNSAIKPFEGNKAVQVIDPQTKAPKYIPVEIGIKSLEKTQIISGIDEGTQVITGAKNGAVKASGGGPFGD